MGRISPPSDRSDVQLTQPESLPYGFFFSQFEVQRQDPNTSQAFTAQLPEQRTPRALMQ